MFAQGSKISMESILYGNFIKYDRLRELIYQEFKGSDATKVNVYIDLNSFLNGCYRSLSQDLYTIPAICLNYCAHLRAFFNKLGVGTNITMVYGLPRSPNNTRYMVEYWNKKYKNQDAVDQQIEFGNNILQVLSPYFNDIYFKYGTVESGVIIKHLMDSVFNNGLPNIVVSTSEYIFQLPAFSNCVVLHKKREQDAGNKIDASYSYNASTAINRYIFEVRKVTSILWIIPEMVSSLICMMGMPQRNVSCIISVPRAFEIMRRIDMQSWLSVYGDITQMYSLMLTNMTSKESNALSFGEYLNRFKAIDINYQLTLYRSLPESADNSFLVRLHDPDKIKEINNNLFINTPINLEWL